MLSRVRCARIWPESHWAGCSCDCSLHLAQRTAVQFDGVGLLVIAVAQGNHQSFQGLQVGNADALSGDLGPAGEPSDLVGQLANGLVRRQLSLKTLNFSWACLLTP